MALVLGIDIETIPDDAAVAEILQAGFDESSVAIGNRTPEKAREYIAQKKAEWADDVVRKAGLSPMTGKVAVAGLWDGTNGGTISLRETGDDEKALLEQFFDLIGKADAVASFNGYRFDWPFLKKRAAKHRVHIPHHLEPRRYQAWPHCDVRMVLGDWDEYARGTLSTWARYFGVECPGKDAGIDGSMVASYIADGRWQEIETYCLGDCQSVIELVRVLMETRFIPPLDLTRRSVKEAA